MDPGQNVCASLCSQWMEGRTSARMTALALFLVTALAARLVRHLCLGSLLARLDTHLRRSVWQYTKAGVSIRRLLRRTVTLRPYTAFSTRAWHFCGWRLAGPHIVDRRRHFSRRYRASIQPV